MRDDRSTNTRETSSFWRSFSPGKTFASGEGGASTGLSRAKILIVEDNLLLSLQIEDALTEAGFEVVGKATSAAQALAFARATRPDLMIVDIRLEGESDGIDAATKILTELGIRSIFASSFSAEDVKGRGTQARPLGWINKPYDTDVLVALVREALLMKGRN